VMQDSMTIEPHRRRRDHQRRRPTSASSGPDALEVLRQDRRGGRARWREVPPPSM
jgi:hypothetical protein